MMKMRVIAIWILIAGLGVGYFVYTTERGPRGASDVNGIQKILQPSRFGFKLGLDLAGGTQLVYRADVSNIAGEDVRSAMTSLRDVIERRVNVFGVSEPLVQVEKSSFVAGNAQERLIVELPGVTDVQKAIAMIGQTPLLEFKLLRKDAASLPKTASTSPSELFTNTGLTGAYLKRASLQFMEKGVSQPVVSLEFNADGSKLFATLTREHKGEVLAIFLDGNPISTPVIRDEITDGTAVISGGFTPTEARELARNLNFGALPVPIELLSTQSVGATLGSAALWAGIRAGIWGFALVALFLILWYRLPGFLATVSLGLYAVIMLALFKLIPVTLTAAGIAGFILSLGMAVDANILIFERMKEERRNGKTLDDAMRAGFDRAWFSIRDANTSSTITALILFWFGTPLVRGFALTLGIGVFVSMLTAISISRTFLLAIRSQKESSLIRFLFGAGIKNTP